MHIHDGFLDSQAVNIGCSGWSYNHPSAHSVREVLSQKQWCPAIPSSCYSDSPSKFGQELGEPVFWTDSNLFVFLCLRRASGFFSPKHVGKRRKGKRKKKSKRDYKFQEPENQCAFSWFISMNWVPRSPKSECGHLVELQLSDSSEEHYGWVVDHTLLKSSDEKNFCGKASHLVHHLVLWFLSIKSNKKQNINTHYDS